MYVFMDIQGLYARPVILEVRFMEINLVGKGIISVLNAIVRMEYLKFWVFWGV